MLVAGNDPGEEEPQAEQSEEESSSDSSCDEVDNIADSGSIAELLERAQGDIGAALHPNATSTNRKGKSGKHHAFTFKLYLTGHQ